MEDRIGLCRVTPRRDLRLITPEKGDEILYPLEGCTLKIRKSLLFHR
jgi:hypothetical protein